MTGSAPHLRITATGVVAPLRPGVTTIGRGSFTDIVVAGPGISVLHAEITRRGPCAYLTDLGSRDGTTVNGRLITSRVLADGDLIIFGNSVTCQAGGIPARTDIDPQPDTPCWPPLTPREHDVLTALCRPATTAATFITPATVSGIAAELNVTGAAVKQHLARLYAKLAIPGHGDHDRRIKLANTAISLGLAIPARTSPDSNGT